MLLGYISLLYKQLLQYTLLKYFTVPYLLYNQISREVLYETFSIRYHYNKIVHENSLALTLQCFISASRTIAKHVHIVITAFCRCSTFVVNGIAEISQHIAGVQHDDNTSRKRLRRDADIRSAAAARRRPETSLFVESHLPSKVALSSMSSHEICLSPRRDSTRRRSRLDVLNLF